MEQKFNFDHISVVWLRKQARQFKGEKFCRPETVSDSGRFDLNGR